MRGTQHFALVLALSTALVFHIKAQKPAITCAAGYHTPGMTATITCHFHGQISTDQNTGVYITRYKLGAPKDDSGKEVLMCHFSGGSVSVCNPEPGYRFINFNKNNLTIEVPDVSPEFQGRYSCGVVPADSRTVIPCLLVVKEDLEVPNKEAQNDPDDSLRHKDLHTRVQTTHNVVVVILIAILMMVAAAAVIYMVIAHKRNWFPFKERTPTDQEAGPGGPATRTLIAQEESVENPICRNNQSSVPPSAAEPLLSKEKSMSQDSHNEAAVATIEENAGEKKAETKKERKAREQREKEEEKAREKKEKEARENKLKEDLKNAASTEQKKQIQKDFKENEKRLKKQREDEKKQKEDEEKRLEQEKNTKAK